MTDVLRYRLGVLSRTVAAIVGGYALAALTSAVLALLLPLLLPLPRVDAALIGTLASFALFAGAVVWVFAARSAWRAWRGLMVMAVPLGLVLWALLGRAGGMA